MQTSSTRVKKPLYLWLARIVTLAIILASIGIGVSWLPEILEKLRHEGVIRDIMWGLDQNGEAIIQYVSPTAEQNGVAIGDKVLNYNDDNIGKIDTPVTLHIQRGTAPARDITFLREPANEVVFGAIQLGLTADSGSTLAFLFILIPVLIGVPGSLILYWLRSDDWMALFTATVVAYFAVPVFPLTNPVVILFNAIMSFFIFFWFILFPNGKLIPRWSWAIVLLTLPSIVYGSAIELGVLIWNERLAPIELTIGLVGIIAGVALIATIYFRYRYTFSPIERQQGKWVITGVIVGLLPLLVTWLVYLFYSYSQKPEESAIAYFFNQSINIVLTVSMTLGIFFSIFRYRLYDVDTFISQAIVYSSLTGILALVGFIVAPLINYALQQSLGNQSALLAVLVSALPIAALFNPIRDRLQQAVERRFKPEEMDFENTFIEFTSELRSLFTVKELSTLLARHAVEQLDIAYASVFLNGQNGHLKHITTICSDKETSEPSLDDKTIEKIRKGQLTSPDGNYAQSLVVPLVVPRSRKPSLLGALVLGPRLQGVGYSTAMAKGLKKFGEEVGKAFYVAEVRGSKE